MEPFAVGSAAGIVLPYTGVGALVFRLAGGTVHLDVVDLHVTIVGVIEKLNIDAAGVVAGAGIVAHAGAEGEGSDRVLVDLEVDPALSVGAAGSEYVVDIAAA